MNCLFTILTCFNDYLLLICKSEQCLRKIKAILGHEFAPKHTVFHFCLSCRPRLVPIVGFDAQNAEKQYLPIRHPSTFSSAAGREIRTLFSIP